MLKRFSAFLLVFLLLISFSTAFSHSGRTDANGGHYDRSNGDYHYHHGHGAHYHPDGICPYDDAPSESSSSSSRSMPSVTVQPTPKPTIKITPAPTPYYSYYDTSDVSKSSPEEEKTLVTKILDAIETGARVIGVLFFFVLPVSFAFIGAVNKRKRR